MASSQAISPGRQTAGGQAHRQLEKESGRRPNYGRLPDEDCLSKGEEDVFMS